MTKAKVMNFGLIVLAVLTADTIKSKFPQIRRITG